MIGLLGEGGDDDSAAATVSTVTAELWSCSHGQCSDVWELDFRHNVTMNQPGAGRGRIPSGHGHGLSII